MRVTIHQPEFMPWLGFFHKASIADLLVLLDDSQYRKNYFQNRNRIRTSESWSWITVPVEKAPLSTPINEIQVAEANNPRWREKISSAIRSSYGRSSSFDAIGPQLDHIVHGASSNLASLNFSLIDWMLERLAVRPAVERSSTMNIQSTASQRILDICIRTGATTYVSGISGPDYLDLPSFTEAGITVELQSFHHPIYPQLFPGFEPQMSAIDAIFALGDRAYELLQGSWPEKIDQVFL